MITSLTPNLDGFLFAETEDENRVKTKHPVILFAALFEASNQQAAIVPFVLIDGKLAPANGRLIRDET